MRRLTPALIAVAVILSPIGAWAAGDAPAPVPGPPGFQYIEQAHSRVEQLHAQARLSVLNALTQAHRNLLAQIVGALAIAPNPDFAAAGKTLDANLSPTEARTIASISTSLEQQTRQIMTAAHQQAMNAMPQGSHANNQHDVMYFAHSPGQGQAWQTDPGLILLHMAMPHMGPMFRMMLESEHTR